MTNQSTLQQQLNSALNLHTGAQNNVPVTPNNGNPNTIHNWGSYSTTPQPGGGLGFNLHQAQVPGLPGANYSSNFSPDPTMAAILNSILSGSWMRQTNPLPPVQQSPILGNILWNFYGPGRSTGYVPPANQTPTPPAPGTPAPPVPGTPAPGTPTPAPGTPTPAPVPPTQGGSAPAPGPGQGGVPIPEFRGMSGGNGASRIYNDIVRSRMFLTGLRADANQPDVDDGGLKDLLKRYTRRA